MAETGGSMGEAADAPNGLSNAEASRLLEKFGENRLPVAGSRSFLKVLALQFLSPLIYILMASAALSMIIMAVVLLVLSLSVTRARKAGGHA